MTITLPLRFIILHFSQIGFTDALTFITSSYASKSLRLALTAQTIII